jgi:hypothetical protein
MDTGVDVAALDDLPDPEVLVSGALNRAYALARRLLNPTGCLEEIGDFEAYDSIDVREWLGDRPNATTLRSRETQAAQVLGADPTVTSVDVTVTYLAGAVRIAVEAEGQDGPTAFVLTVDKVTASLLMGS